MQKFEIQTTESHLETEFQEIEKVEKFFKT